MEFHGGGFACVDTGLDSLLDLLVGFFFGFLESKHLLFLFGFNFGFQIVCKFRHKLAGLLDQRRFLIFKLDMIKTVDTISWFIFHSLIVFIGDRGGYTVHWNFNGFCASHCGISWVVVFIWEKIVSAYIPLFIFIVSFLR